VDDEEREHVPVVAPKPVSPAATATREILAAAALLGACTLIALALRRWLAPTNLAMVYLLGVVAIATQCSRRVSVAASVLSVAVFDFFCVPPYLTFVVSDYEYLVTFAGMLVVALVISTQTARIRESVRAALEREARTQALYQLSRNLTGQTRVFEAARAAASLAEDVFGTTVVIFLADEGRISFRKRTSDQVPVPLSEEAVAQWAFDHATKSGNAMDHFQNATALYVPLRGARETFGVLCALPDRGGRIFRPEQQKLLEVFTNQTAQAMERIFTQNAADDARLRVEAEQMRSSLLSAISHDLRTPLASITGAASTLRSQGDKLRAEVRTELLDSISDEAERLSRLVGNLLDITRFESGVVDLRRDLYPLEEIVGTALQRLERQIEGRVLVVSLPESLPAVFVDDVLIGQVLVNLIENALKYTPSETPLEIAAESAGDAVILEVRDRGPGIATGEEERIFEKFYRVQEKSRRGAGLGLAICRAILQAHRGSIVALNREGGGAIFRVRLTREKES
jgi:two-component system, OmpR family, sensor histidine kinase KdpD